MTATSYWVVVCVLAATLVGCLWSRFTSPVEALEVPCDTAIIPHIGNGTRVRLVDCDVDPAQYAVDRSGQLYMSVSGERWGRTGYTSYPGTHRPVTLFVPVPNPIAERVVLRRIRDGAAAHARLMQRNPKLNWSGDLEGVLEPFAGATLDAEIETDLHVAIRPVRQLKLPISVPISALIALLLLVIAQRRWNEHTNASPWTF